MFTKIEARLPAVIVSALIFIYRQQYAWVCWGNTSKSEIFTICNGARQGSVLSPALFSVYVQDLLDKVQNLRVGCHIGSTFLADDFLLLAPNPAATQQMLDLAANFGLRNNLEFSCDPDPAKTKSKAIYMIGKKKNLPKPAGLQLYGKSLPWVTHATHLGHEFHEDGTMTMDAKMKEATLGRALRSWTATASPPLLRCLAMSSSLPPTFTAGCSGGWTAPRLSRLVAAGTLQSRTCGASVGRPTPT